MQPVVTLEAEFVLRKRGVTFAFRPPSTNVLPTTASTPTPALIALLMCDTLASAPRASEQGP